MARSTVDFPAPFGTNDAGDAAGPHVEVECLQHIATAVAGEHCFEVDHRFAPVSSSMKSSPRYASSTAGSELIVDGSPSAITEPRASTMAMSDSVSTKCMSCSTITIVRPESCSAADQHGQSSQQRRVDPGGWFVEQDHLGIEHQHLGELDEFALTVRQVSRFRTDVLAHADELQQLRRPGDFGTRYGTAGKASELEVGVDHCDVLENGQAVEKSGKLVRTGNPGKRSPCAVEPVQCNAIKSHRSRRGTIRAIDDVEDGRLARSVGSDQRGHRAGTYVRVRRGRGL